MKVYLAEHLPNPEGFSSKDAWELYFEPTFCPVFSDAEAAKAHLAKEHKECWDGDTDDRDPYVDIGNWTWDRENLYWEAEDAYGGEILRVYEREVRNA